MSSEYPLESIVARRPDIAGGELVFAGTDEPVRDLIEHLKSGDPLNDFTGHRLTPVTRDQTVAYLEATLELTRSHLASRHHELEQIISEKERVRPPVHPGRVLELEWLEPLNMSVNTLADALGLDPHSLNEVVEGRRAVTAEVALRLARWWGMRAGFWMGLQSRYDLEIAEWKDDGRIKREVTRYESHEQ